MIAVETIAKLFGRNLRSTPPEIQLVNPAGKIDFPNPPILVELLDRRSPTLIQKTVLGDADGNKQEVLQMRYPVKAPQRTNTFGEKPKTEHFEDYYFSREDIENARKWNDGYYHLQPKQLMETHDRFRINPVFVAMVLPEVERKIAGDTPLVLFDSTV